MSEPVSPLALSRAQVTAIVLASLVGAAALVNPSRAPVLVATALMIGAGAIRFNGSSPAERAQRAIGYLARSRWTRFVVRSGADGVEIVARGTRQIIMERLEPRGRLDLSGDDEALASSLAGLIERASRLGAEQWVSWHVELGERGPFIIIARPVGVSGLTASTPLGSSHDVADAVGLGAATGWILERWSHVRLRTGVACVLRASSTTPVTAAAALLASEPGVRVTTTARVLPRERAERVAGRHSVRWSADATVASRLGFRTKARDRLAATSIERREGDVAAGRALAQFIVSVIVVAPSISELDTSVAAVIARARRFGVSLRRQNGRQAPTLCAQLPGSPAWAGT